MTLLLPQAVHIRAYYYGAPTDQTIATPGTPQAVLFDQVPDYGGIVLKNSSNQQWNGGAVATGQRFVVPNAGDYLINFEAAPFVSTGAPARFRIWMRCSTGGGAAADVTASSTAIVIASNSSAGVPPNATASRSIIYDAALPGDYFEFWMDGEVNTGLRGTAPATGPVSPAIVVCINQIGYEYV